MNCYIDAEAAGERYTQALKEAGRVLTSRDAALVQDAFESGVEWARDFLEGCGYEDYDEVE